MKKGQEHKFVDFIGFALILLIAQDQVQDRKCAVT